MKKICLILGVLIALFSSGCKKSTEDQVRRVNDKYCKKLKKDKDYDKCLAKFDELREKYPEDRWTVCSFAVKLSARCLRNDALMVERYTSKYDPEMCAMWTWGEKNREPMLSAINHCEKLGGAPWMSAAAWKEYLLKVTAVKPLSDIGDRCRKKTD